MFLFILIILLSLIQADTLRMVMQISIGCMPQVDQHSRAGFEQIRNICAQSLGTCGYDPDILPQLGIQPSGTVLLPTVTHLRL